MSSIPTRDQWFLDLAYKAAERSKDKSTKVGVVLVAPDNGAQVIGYNGFPRGVNDNIAARHERPEKYLWSEHAERNAIYNAARNGFPTKGCTMYGTWFPCVDCSRAIIQAGIVRLVLKEVPDWQHERWGEQWRFAARLMQEASVAVFYLEK